MNEPVLYIPWFKEPLNGNQPWVVIWKLAYEFKRDFSRMILPWDTRYDSHGKFSLSAVRKQVGELIEEINKPTVLVTYSLSSLPVLWAVCDYWEWIKSKVSKIVFLHPSTNPVDSVAEMDRCLKRGKWEDHNISPYLEWDPNVEFKTLINWWKGNWEQFQRDLIELNKNQIDITASVTNLSLDFSIISSSDDAIVNPGVRSTKELRITDVIRSHIPDLTNQRFIY